MAVALLKSNELVDRLQVQLDAQHPDELELRRLNDEATRLVRGCGGDPDIASEAYCIIGAVAFMRGKDDEGRAAFATGLKLSPRREIRTNYCVFLRRRLFLREAFQVIDDLASVYRDDAAILRLAADVSVATLQLDKALAHIEALRRIKASPAFGEDIAELMQVGESVAVFCRRVTDRDGGYDKLLDLLSTAADVVRERHGRYIGVSLDATDEGELMLHFRVRGNVEMIADTNFAIADAIVSHHDDTMMDLVTFSCLPIQ